MAGALFALGANEIGQNIKEKDRLRKEESRRGVNRGILDALGTEPGVFNADTFPGEAQIPGLQTAGTGLLADPDSRGNQLRFGAEIAQLDGLQDQGFGLLRQSLGFGNQAQQQKSGFGQQDRLQKNKFKFDAEQNQLNRNQRQMIETAKLNAAAGKKSDFGGFATKAAQVAATVTQNKEFTKLAAIPSRAILRFNDATDLIAKAGGFVNMSGADDLALIKNFNKFLLPDEAVMSDDAIQAVKSSSMWQQLQAMSQSITGEKGASLSPEARENLYATMVNLAQGRVEELERMISNATNLADQTGVQPGAVIGKQTQQKPAFERQKKPVSPQQRENGERWTDNKGNVFEKSDTGTIFRMN